MSTDKIRNFIETLHAKTQAGEVPWEATADPTIFEARLGDHIVAIDCTKSFDNVNGSEEYPLSIINKRGEIVDTIGGTLFQGDSRDSLKNLYVTARCYACGTEHAIDSILSLLR